MRMRRCSDPPRRWLAILMVGFVLLFGVLGSLATGFGRVPGKAVSGKADSGRADPADGFGILRPRPARELDALPRPPLLDTDGDFLPDNLEWVLLSDPTRRDTNSDGRNDLLQAMDYEAPRHKTRALKTRDSMRVLVNTSGSKKNRLVWITLLLRLASGRLSDLRALQVYMTVGNRKVLLDPLLPYALEDVKTRYIKDQGMLVRLSFRLKLDSVMRYISSTTIGSCGLIGSTLVRSGTVLMDINGYHTLSFFSDTTNDNQGLALQTTGAFEDENPYWSLNKLCVLALEMQGVGHGWLICEVTKADCQQESSVRCTSNCGNANGLTFFLPDGGQLLTGR